MSGGQDSTVGI